MSLHPSDLDPSAGAAAPVDPAALVIPDDPAALLILVVVLAGLAGAIVLLVGLAWLVRWAGYAPLPWAR